MATFISDGKPIRLDHYPPNHPGSSPAVILIHGSGGPLHRQVFRGLAQLDAMGRVAQFFRIYLLKAA